MSWRKFDSPEEERRWMRKHAFLDDDEEEPKLPHDDDGPEPTSLHQRADAYINTAFEAMLHMTWGFPEASHVTTILRQYCNFLDDGRRPDPIVQEFVDWCVRRIADGIDPVEAFGMKRGRGRIPTIEQFRREGQVAHYVWYHWKHGGKSLENSQFDAADEFHMSYENVRDIWVRKKWGKRFKFNAAALKRGYFTEPGDMSASFRKILEHLIHEGPDSPDAQ